MIGSMAQENQERKNMPRLVLVSGPSGVGKGPIIEWTKKLYLPNLCQVKVRKTQTARHSGKEDDLGFGGMSKRRYVFPCRDKLQALDLAELDNALEQNDVVLMEVYYKALPDLKRFYSGVAEVVSTFISPLSSNEIQELKQNRQLETYLKDNMLDTLVHRALKEGKAFTTALTTELGTRIDDVSNELNAAASYDQVIVNHCYEADTRWRLPILVGEPKHVVEAVRDIIVKGRSDYAHEGKHFFPS